MEIYKEWVVTFTLFPRVTFIVELEKEVQTNEIIDVRKVVESTPVKSIEENEIKPFKYKRFTA